MNAPRSGRDEDQALFYAMGRNKPILNINPHTEDQRANTTLPLK